ncbi:hypothetical protein BCR32DRAFT_267809 [Anaeromyces robustus]|uniref:Uncharacterized protein n=1 Tax=Anaeromyces robustus TaxID=1754192 RepID=A0A1Y1X8Y2_9FUNG|nr:hypothetical protein BCR32DRAFT_267809 [Anaeromyces robustus]|eukprot:ORX82178.1 hypothetical protein BCR32DRAFT_267809 [Anaeromyces robustus]
MKCINYYKLRRDNSDEIIKNLISIKDLDSFRRYLQLESIKITDLNYSKCNVLLYFIDNNSSIDIIDYIIINGKYSDINKKLQYYEAYDENRHRRNTLISPLELALKNNNFELADFLIDIGAKIYFYKYSKFYCFFNILNTENSEYILNKGLQITSNLIKDLIQFNKNDCLCSILKHLSLPSFSRNFPKEKGNKPLIRKSVYKIAIDNHNYRGFSVLYHYDTRDKKRIVKDISEILKTPKEKKSFLYNIKKSENLLFNLNELYTLLIIYQPWTPQEIEETLFRLIKNNEYDKLINYIEKYNIQENIMKNKRNYSINSFINDILDYQISPKMFDFIISQCQAESSYLNIDKFLFKALKNNNFKLADYIITKYPNYQFNSYFIELYNDHSLTSQNFNFILLNNHEYKEDNVLELKEFLLYNHITLNDLRKFNAEPNDFLCYAIDKENPSIEMINYILNYYNNELNYFIWSNKGKRERVKEYNCPLSYALANHYFSIAEILIKHGADINYKNDYTSIFDILYQKRQLTCTNIKFMFNHGFKITTNEINKLINYKDNSRISYDNNQTLSDKELNDIINKERSNIFIDENVYICSILNHDDYDIELFIENECPTISIFKDINKINTFDIKFFISQSFQSKTFSFEKINFTNILYHLINIPKYDYSIDLSIYFIEKVVSHREFDYTTINMNKCIKYLLSAYGDSQFLILQTFLEELMKCKDFNLNIIIKEKIIKIINLSDNIELINTSKRILFNN